MGDMVPPWLPWLGLRSALVRDNFGLQGCLTESGKGSVCVLRYCEVRPDLSSKSQPRP